MHTGPRLQNELPDILLRWRTRTVVFIVDIEKMYRQIKISDEDKKFNLVFWRLSPLVPVQEYQMTTLTYGTASEPYLVVRSIQQLARDERHPEAAKVTLRDFYVHDLLFGSQTVEKAIKL